MWGDQGGLGQPYLGQQLGEVLHKDTKGGPAEGQVAGSGVWLHGVACGLVRIDLYNLGLLLASSGWSLGRLLSVLQCARLASAAKDNLAPNASGNSQGRET